MPGDLIAEEGHGAGVGVGKAEQHPDEGRLPGPVRAEVTESAPRGTHSSTPLTAIFAPKRLLSPWVSTAHWLSAACLPEVSGIVAVLTVFPRTLAKSCSRH